VRVTVVIACYTERRWGRLVRAIDSALGQSLRPAEVVVVVDHNDALRARIARARPDVTVLANPSPRGASGARNTGALHASTELVAFLDDDAHARPDWLARLVTPFANPGVVGTGGAVEPDWDGRRPAWFPPEFDWVVGASYRGMPEQPSVVRNVWAESMAVRRDGFVGCGGFRVGFGKLGQHSRPEDTDLCIRMTQDGVWIYEPGAVVAHHVPAERSTFGFFVRRSYAEGRGKAELEALLPASTALHSEREYLRRVVPAAALDGVRGAFRPGGLRRAARSGAVLTGVAAAGAGFARGRLSARLTAHRAAPALRTELPTTPEVAA